MIVKRKTEFQTAKTEESKWRRFCYILPFFLLFFLLLLSSLKTLLFSICLYVYIFLSFFFLVFAVSVIEEKIAREMGKLFPFFSFCVPLVLLLSISGLYTHTLYTHVECIRYRESLAITTLPPCPQFPVVRFDSTTPAQKAPPLFLLSTTTTTTTTRILYTIYVYTYIIHIDVCIICMSTHTHTHIRLKRERNI